MANSPVQRTGTSSGARESVIAQHSVLRNTYMLLSMTLLFSAVMAIVSMNLPIPRGVAMVSSIAAIGLLWFVLPRFENSSAGIGIVFAVTGLLGFGLGPMLSYYTSLPNGGSMVATALGGTGGIFLALSAFVLYTRRDFSFMAGFLGVGLIVLFGAIIVSLFTSMPGLHLAISAAMILIMSGYLLMETSQILHGGETNYIRATVSLFISLFNIFTSLLHLLGIAGDD